MARQRKQVEEVTEAQAPAMTEEMIEEIKNEIAGLVSELDTSLRFNASAKRARKHTNTLQKMFKVFRAASVAHWKKV